MMRARLAAVGVLGPGLPDWDATRAVIRGERAYEHAPLAMPVAQRLPPAERRRVGTSVRMAIAVATQAFGATSIPTATTATVFASSGADGENCHALCEALAAADPIVSPTRFTNSVHNAPAGYWSIAEQATAASTSVCAYDWSFGAGLLEAMTRVATEGEPVALVAYDVPYPEPLNGVRPIPAPFGVALVLLPDAPGPRGARAVPAASHPALDATDAATRPDVPVLAVLELVGLAPGEPSPAREPALEALRAAIPAARALPLLERIAHGGGGVRIAWSDERVLELRVHASR